MNKRIAKKLYKKFVFNYEKAIRGQCNHNDSIFHNNKKRKLFKILSLQEIDFILDKVHQELNQLQDDKDYEVLK